MRDEKGQTLVEYVLLLGVVAILVLQIMDSRFFKDFFSGNGVLFGTIKKSMENTYRHSHLDYNLNPQDNYSGYQGLHHSYSFPGQSDTRFFLVTRPYGTSL